MNWVQTIEPSRLVFIDETGCSLAMTPMYARSPKNQRVYDRKPVNRGRNQTVIGALTLDGLDAVFTIEGYLDGIVFLAYVTHILLPTLLPGDIVILDNLRAHQTNDVREAIESVGAEVVFQPPYSPDLNPIEECWSKPKNALRKLRARTRETFIDALASAMKTITDNDAEGWFIHARSMLELPTSD